MLTLKASSLSLSLSSRPSSSEGWRQQLTIPVSSSSIALCPLTSPLAECTCTPSNLLCRWSTVFLVYLDNVFLPCFLLVQSVLAVRHFRLQHDQSTVASTWPLWPWVLFPHQVLQGYLFVLCFRHETPSIFANTTFPRCIKIRPCKVAN